MKFTTMTQVSLTPRDLMSLLDLHGLCALALKSLRDSGDIPNETVLVAGSEHLCRSSEDFDGDGLSFSVTLGTAPKQEKPPSPPPPKAPAATSTPLDADERIHTADDWAKFHGRSRTWVSRMIDKGVFVYDSGTRPKLYRQAAPAPESEPFDYKAISGPELAVRILYGRRPCAAKVVIDAAEKIRVGGGEATRRCLKNLVEDGFVTECSMGYYSLDTDKFSPLSGRSCPSDIEAVIDMIKEAPQEVLSTPDIRALGITDKRLAEAIDAGWLRYSKGRRVGYWRLGALKGGS